jgi:hypothetical protein
MEESNAQVPRDSSIRRRRQILYTAALLVLGVLVAVAILPGLKSDKPKTSTVPPKTPVILARINLKSVAGQTGSGVAELLRRGSTNSLRVLAIKLPPNKTDDEAYQLVLAGKSSSERLLGTAIVGKQGVFVGEAKLGIDELERYRRIELRRVTRGSNPTAENVLRGRIPR